MLPKELAGLRVEAKPPICYCVTDCDLTQLDCADRHAGLDLKLTGELRRKVFTDLHQFLELVMLGVRSPLAEFAGTDSAEPLSALRMVPLRVPTEYGGPSDQTL